MPDPDEVDFTFIGAALRPVDGSLQVGGGNPNGPVLPGSFNWKSGRLDIVRVIRTWKETGPCTHGSGEQYLRKHWFEVETAKHERARIYFDRQARGRRPTARWWLFSKTE